MRTIWMISLLSMATLVGLAWRQPPPSQPTEIGAVKAKEDCSGCHRKIVDAYASSSHAGLACSQCHAGSLAHQEAEDPAIVLPAVDMRITACGGCHRFQSETYLMSEPGLAGAYGGTPADPHASPKTKDFPAYNKIVEGHGFTKEYNEERSHAFMLLDHINIKRSKNAACLNCKSTQVAYNWGEKLKNVPLNENSKWDDVIALLQKETLEYGAGCNHCHDPHAGKLRIVNKGLKAAIAKWGVNPYWQEKNAKSFDEAEKQQREILVCAQCHVEYSCGPGVDKKVRFEFGWHKARDLDTHYRERFNYQQDWVHTTLNEPLIKSQHPETEFFWESKYERAGASCVTCHMPKVDVDGRTLTSHWLTSPVRYLDRYVQNKPLGAFPCQQCHTVKPEVLKQQVIRVQKHVDDSQKRVQQALSESLDLIAIVKKAKQDGKPVKDDFLQQAIQLHQQAHVLWENLVVSENSMGFHNPEEAFKSMNEALDNARQAQMLCLKAMQ